MQENHRSERQTYNQDIAGRNANARSGDNTDGSNEASNRATSRNLSNSMELNSRGHMDGQRPLPDRPDQIEPSLDNRYESINATLDRESETAHIQTSTGVINNRENLEGSGVEAERHMPLEVHYQSHCNVQGPSNYEGGHSAQYNFIPHQGSTIAENKVKQND